MFCSNCGTPLGAQAIFCVTCGAQRSASVHTASVPPPVIQPARKRKSSSFGKWFALAAVCLALWFVLFSGSSGSANSSSPSAAPATLNKLGQTVTVGYWSYQVHGVDWKSSIGGQYMPEKPDAAFLIVDLSATNNDNTASTLPPLKLIDAAGREHEESSKSWVLENSFGPLKSLNPTVTSRGYAVFDVPPGDYKLKVSGGLTSDENTFIALRQ